MPKVCSIRPPKLSWCAGRSTCPFYLVSLYINSFFFFLFYSQDQDFACVCLETSELDKDGDTKSIPLIIGAIEKENWVSEQIKSAFRFYFLVFWTFRTRKIQINKTTFEHSLTDTHTFHAISLWSIFQFGPLGELGFVKSNRKIFNAVTMANIKKKANEYSFSEFRSDISWFIHNAT